MHLYYINKSIHPIVLKYLYYTPEAPIGNHLPLGASGCFGLQLFRLVESADTQSIIAILRALVVTCT